MEFVNILENEKNNQEFAMENMSFTSTLRTLKEMGFDYVKDLGFGKFGKVIEMIHPNTKTTCAVKIVKEENTSDGELHLWSTLCHENILPLKSFNYIAQCRTFIFITKKCPFSLDQKLGDVGLIFDSNALRRVVSWTKDVAMALAFLHKKKLAHMDIKTNNVLITVEGKAVLTDFGSLTSIEKPNSEYISPIPYRPPECYAVDGNWEIVDNVKYDTWTFAMMCIRVFTRENFCQSKSCLQNNFWPKTMYHLIFDIIQKKYFAEKMRACFPRSKDYLQKVDDALNLIKACLHLDPQKRVTIKEALNHKLFGGQIIFEVEENSPWNERAGYQEIKKLISELKMGSKNTNVSSEECYENDNVKERNVDVQDKLMINAKINKEKCVTPVNQVERAFTDKEIGNSVREKVAVPCENVENCDTNDEKKFCNAKISKQMVTEVILTARTLYDDVKSQDRVEKYLKEMESQVNQVKGTKRMNKIVGWARAKKNSFCRIFARYHSTN